ncbi:MAG TPA: SEC-C domain-containing protein [Clostridiaceae bacterium]|nr:SEC-C domain-containing protein [Clostridiaceae bacterium]
MGLYQEWTKKIEEESQKRNFKKFWDEYLEKEKENYITILEKHNEVISGKLSELAEKFNMDTVTMTGFLDGINTSLVKPLDLEELTEDSEISLEVDFEKLYWNMLDAKADWLYNLPQWDDILSAEKRAEITKNFRQSKIAVSNKVGRNDPCPCGSGKKYKKCCGKNN